MQRGFLSTLCVATGIVFAATAQAHPTISSDAVPGVNFSSYTTYSWVSSAAPSGLDPVMFQRITANFDQGLAAQGYRRADSGDLSLVVTVGAQNKTDVESWGRFGLQTSVYQYTEGQLSLDAFDTKTKQALWHGQVSETFDPEKPNLSAIDFGHRQAHAAVPGYSCVGNRPCVHPAKVVALPARDAHREPGIAAADAPVRSNPSRPVFITGESMPTLQASHTPSCSEDHQARAL